MSQMISLVQGLHQQGILHGDLKLANFLFHKERIWLCDFEESQRINEAGQPSSATMMYRPIWRARQSLCERHGAIVVHGR
jgi:tRNA A-37 threonylcarbamoyl transferase component Bud32